MKVIVLSYGDEQIGVFSSKQKASFAENELKTLEHFQNNSYYQHEEFEIDKFSIEEFDEIISEPTNETAFDKVRNGFCIIIGFIAIISLLFIIILGIASFGKIITEFLF
jgi:hypothetical protein